MKEGLESIIAKLIFNDEKFLSDEETKKLDETTKLFEEVIHKLFPFKEVAKDGLPEENAWYLTAIDNYNKESQKDKPYVFNLVYYSDATETFWNNKLGFSDRMFTERVLFYLDVEPLKNLFPCETK